jgi:hypothetical protein
MKLKEQMFAQFATSGLTDLLKDFQKKYTPKKGMRFNKNNITYEIGAPKISSVAIEYEISSKIPSDELPSQKEKDSYFQKVKDIVSKAHHKPVSMEMENIVWNAEKDTEKKREYVKLVYRYPFDTLYDEKKILKEAEEIKKNPTKKEVPHIPGIMTTVGKLVLVHLKENLTKSASETMEAFIKANETVQKEFCK